MAINAEQLTKDLRECDQIAQEAVKQVKDEGTCNMDAVFLCLPRMRETKALDAIKAAGLYCRAKRKWIGEGYMLHGNSGGQANKREHYVTVLCKELTDRGYQALTFRKID